MHRKKEPSRFARQVFGRWLRRFERIGIRSIHELDVKEDQFTAMRGAVKRLVHRRATVRPLQLLRDDFPF